MVAVRPASSHTLVTAAVFLGVAAVGWAPLPGGLRADRPAWEFIAAGLLARLAGAGIWPGSPVPLFTGRALADLLQLTGGAMLLAGTAMLAARLRNRRALDELGDATVAGLVAAVVLGVVHAATGAIGLRVPGVPAGVSLGVFAADVGLVLVAARLALASGGHRRARVALVVAATAQLLLDLAGLDGAFRLGRGGVTIGLALATTGAWVAASIPRSLADSTDPQRTVRVESTARAVTLCLVMLAMQAVLLTAVAARRGLPGLAAPGAALLTTLVAGVYLGALARRATAAERRSHHDELTGLPNRTLFEDRLSAAIDRARRTESELAVLFLDLDQFKNVNDSLGHPAGNRLLQAVARRLESCVRSGETVSRFGGDEFTVLLTDLDGPTAAAAAAQRLLDAFAEPVIIEKRKLFAGLSIGVAHYPADGANASTLLRNADSAMYLAKQRGRRRYELYSRELSDRVHQRLALETELHTAIERDELELHYQPKVDLASAKVVSVEALLRWRHPTRGYIPPSEFVPIAEDTGMIAQLGEWVLREACQQARVWQDADLGPLGVAVNLSPGQFAGPIDDTVAHILRQTGLRPSLLELEITEGLAMESGPRTLDTLQSIRQMGVRLAIDDFGTGFAALSYLTRWPIDHLKIDKTFVQAIDRTGENSAEAAIVKAVLAMAHSLGLEVTAEGVETVNQLRFLEAHGCHLIQGYLFSAAVPPEKLENILMLENVAAGPGRLGFLGDDLRPSSCASVA
jgi:diguanylate cyclase (GGDEF)-like protein